MPLRRLLPVILLLSLVPQVLADTVTARRDFERGVAARERAEYTIAIDAFTKALREDDRSEYELALAEVLGWSRRFDDAATHYKNVLRREPRSRAAHLGLAQVRLWQQRYDDAAREYSALLRLFPSDVDARRGLATANYWSGDFRAARRDYDALLRLNPGDSEAREALAAIHAASAPLYRIEAESTSDDQPMQRSLARISYEHFLDPLTRVTAAAGTIHLEADERRESATAPFAGLGISTAWPSRKLRAEGSLRLLRFPNGETDPLGSVSFLRTLGRSTLALSVDRTELLHTASSLDDHPTATTSTLRWSRDHNGTLSAAAARATSYFDGNNGISADAYHLVRVLNRQSASLSIGASAAYRDTEETRFALDAASSVRAADGTYIYRYRASYDPYWTPHQLVEARVLAVSQLRYGRITVDLHGDGGIGRDLDLLFGPSSGSSAAAPLYAAPIENQRTFHPWRASATLSWPLGARHALTAAVEHQSTAFYNANTFHAGVTGRFR